MLIRNANDVLMSQAVDKEEEQIEVETSAPQKRSTEGSRNSDESSYNPEQNQEDFSPHDNGRSSVISDPGYISCAGSDHSSLLSVEGEQVLEDCVGYNSTEYNAVISPCNSSITDVLNDTYIASSRNSPISDTDSIFGAAVDFMPSTPRPNPAADNLEKTLCERAKSLQQGSISNPDMPAAMNWSSVHQNNSIPSTNYDQRIDFDTFFEGVLESNSSSSIFSTASEKYHQNQNNIPASQHAPFVPAQANDFSRNQECKSDLHADEFSSYTVEDFCFDGEILGANANMHETAPNRNLPPSGGYHDSEFLQQHQTHSYCSSNNNNNNTSVQCARYQESSSSEPYDFSTTASRRTNGSTQKRMQARVFALTSSEKAESASASGSVDAKHPAQTPTSAEEEAWRSYLENPITAATTAMMSFYGDEDSAAALGKLYDHYKVPREKRFLGYSTKANEVAQGRTLLPQRNSSGSATTLGAVPTTLKGVPCPANSSIHNRKLGTEVLTTPVKSEPDSGVQVFDSVSNIIKHHRPASLDESKVKTEIITESPQDLSTAFPDASAKVAKPPSRLCSTTSNGSNASYISNSTSNFTTLSPFSTSLANSYYTNSAQSSIYSGDHFEYIMEAPKSLKQKESDPTMSYINKGQFYCITLRSVSDQWKFKSPKVRSVVQIVFGDGKSEEEQVRHWKYWHARQHTVKQRIIDIADYKESSMIYDVSETAHNAISFSWNVTEIARIFISCNCLSTDFSAQKGIKGLPLLIQIDTYVDAQDIPFHRGHCQIKVFCDKGAERKIRDEERKATKRRQKHSKQNPNMNTNSSNTTSLMTISTPELNQMVTSSSTTPSAAGQNQPKKTDFVIFKTVNDPGTKPVLFIPEIPGHSAGSHCNAVSVSPTATSSLSPHIGLTAIGEAEPNYFGSSELCERGVKRAHSEDEQPSHVSKVSKTDENERVLLYVRKEDEEVYDGLMLKTPDLNGLKLAIQDKYGCDAESIKEVFKKSKKGILVRMDDNIVRHYSNEDTFVIDVKDQVADDITTFKVTFTEV